MAQNTLTCTISSTDVDLTADGGIDWAKFGIFSYSLAKADWKAGAGALISSAVEIGSGTGSLFYTGLIRELAWTDGTNLGSFSFAGGLRFEGTGTGRGYKVTFPAGTAVKRARLYVASYDEEIKITSTLSDGSVSPQVSTALTRNAGTFRYGYAEVQYAAASAGQSLDIQVENNTADQYVMLMGASYADGTAASAYDITRMRTQQIGLLSR